MRLVVVPCNLREARAFVDLHHRHHRAPQGGLFAVGAADMEQGAMAGVAIVGNPVARMLDDGFTAEVTRLCVLEHIANACSMLYAACWRAARAIGYRKLITYTLATEGGGQPSCRRLAMRRRSWWRIVVALVAPARRSASNAEQAPMGGAALILRAPFPWFGGKSRAASIVWSHFGNVPNYVEPFAGSLAVLLARPHDAKIETVNDLDCYLANFWRAVSAAPELVAEHADWPVNEADLHARHRALVADVGFRERMKNEPEFFDAKLAGWWVWGLCQWIGGGWCATSTEARRKSRIGEGTLTHEKRPTLHHQGKGVHRGGLKRGADRGAGTRPSLGSGGMGVHALTHNKIPYLDNGGRGVAGRTTTSPRKPQVKPHGIERLPSIGTHGRGTHGRTAPTLLDWMQDLAARLRRVRVCCGDWKRVLGPTTLGLHEGMGMSPCAVMLDPPYDQEHRDGDLYSEDARGVSADVRAWALENGDNPKLRIALCGYEGEHAMPPSWRCVPWKAHGGYGHSNGNEHRERIWFSPHCVSGAAESPLFAHVGGIS